LKLLKIKFSLKIFLFKIKIPDTKVVLSECKRATNIAKEFKKRYGNEMIYNMELNDCQKMKVKILFY